MRPVDGLVSARKRWDGASLHRTEIGLLETGARTPRIDTLIKLAAALGIHVDCALLEGIEWTLGKTEAGAFTTRRDETR